LSYPAGFQEAMDLVSEYVEYWEQNNGSWQLRLESHSPRTSYEGALMGTNTVDEHMCGDIRPAEEGTRRTKTRQRPGEIYIRLKKQMA
jgi:hypothetical protein